MAGMFYTLQEVVEKLGKNESEIKGLVKEGKLREFRDGAKQLYKIEDVDAIASTAKSGDAILNDSLEISIDETGEVSLAPEELDVLMGTGDKKVDTKFKLDETGELMAEEKLDDSPVAGSKSDGSEILLSPGETGSGRLDTGMPVDAKSSASSISLDASSQQGVDLSSNDTKISSAGGDTINVLSDSDTGYKISDDASGDTKLIDKKPKALDQKGPADDAGIARLDEDINLEGAGSGSGLLDLSLQADDTSLGAVLDDIYPESQAAGAGAADQTPIAQAPLAAEDDQMFQAPPESQSEVDVPDEVIPQQDVMPVGVGVGAGAAIAFEAPADTTSNIFGALLFVPFAILIYSAIAVMSGYLPLANMQIVSAVGPIIWYVAAGLSAVTIIGALIASAAGSPKKPKAPKAPKAPKVKQPKPVKEKKAKSK